MAATASSVAGLRAPDPGSLNRRVQLYDVPTEVLDEYGQPGVDAGTMIGTFWAGVRLMRWQEKAAAQQVTILATHVVMLRWLGTAIPATASNPHRLILPGMYLIIVEDGTRLDVLEADDVLRAHVYWSLTCQQRTTI